MREWSDGKWHHRVGLVKDKLRRWLWNLTQQSIENINISILLIVTLQGFPCKICPTTLRFFFEIIGLDFLSHLGTKTSGAYYSWVVNDWRPQSDGHLENYLSTSRGEYAKYLWPLLQSENAVLIRERMPSIPTCRNALLRSYYAFEEIFKIPTSILLGRESITWGVHQDRVH
jgi:hypothetical protein